MRLVKTFTATEFKILDNIIAEFGTMSVVNLCKKYSITPKTLHFWLSTNPTYKTRYEEAKYKQKIVYNEELFELSETILLKKVKEENFPAVKYALEMRDGYEENKKTIIQYILDNISQVLPVGKLTDEEVKTLVDFFYKIP